MDESKIYKILGSMFLVGTIIGLGQLLASEEKLTWRIIFGRALSSGGLALGAGSILSLYPDISLVALVGISAVIASLGTSFLETALRGFLPKGGS